MPFHLSLFWLTVAGWWCFEFEVAGESYPREELLEVSQCVILIFWRLGATYPARWPVLPYFCFIPVFLHSIQDQFFSRLILSMSISSTLIYPEILFIYIHSIYSFIHIHIHSIWCSSSRSFVLFSSRILQRAQPVVLLLLLLILTRLNRILANFASPKSTWHFSDCLLSW